MALNVDLIWGQEQSRRDATFQHDGQISIAARDVCDPSAQAKYFCERDWTLIGPTPRLICPSGRFGAARA
jgi:hypothetical protein